MHCITYDTLRKFAERECGIPLNVDLLWGLDEKVVYPAKTERVYFRLFTNLKRTSHKGKYHKKDNGHTLTMDMVKPLIHHFQRTKVFPLGAVTVKP